MGTFIPFLEKNCWAVTKKYWELKKEEILNPTFFVLFSFLYLCNNRGTYSKYFPNNIYETDISSASQ